MADTAATVTRYTLAVLLGIAAALLAIAHSAPREIVCDHPQFRPHAVPYATAATCNDGIVVVILD